MICRTGRVGFLTALLAMQLFFPLVVSAKASADRSVSDEAADTLPSGSLSSDASAMIKLLDLQPLIDRLASSKVRVNGVSQSDELAYLTARQDLLESREELSRKILKTNLEVDYVLSAIDGEQNHYLERIEELMARRDKAVWYTTIFSQWSNGILWSASSAFTCASVKYPRLSYDDGILGILAGAIPTILSLYAMHQSHGGKIASQVNPNMLAPVFDRSSRAEAFFPSTVLAYLNDVPPGRGDSKSRRLALRERWQQKGYFDKPGGSDYDRMVGILTATEARKKALTISVFQNRQHMLEDLRTEVFQMKRVLVELIKLTD